MARLREQVEAHIQAVAGAVYRSFRSNAGPTAKMLNFAKILVGENRMALGEVDRMVSTAYYVSMAFMCGRRT